jgi:predicted amidophosphoribosyltransferase
MRERHFPRVCLTCSAPMARQEDTCWRCASQWVSEDAPQRTLKVIDGGRLDADRWANEGGSVAAEAAAPVR